MIPESFTDRRRTARIPTDATLLHRAVGMHYYDLCDVVNVTTSGLELLLDNPLDVGTCVTILVRPEETPNERYRVVGRVDRRRPWEGKWLHVVRAASRRPWSPMLIYDLMCQTLSRSKLKPSSGTKNHNGHHYQSAGPNGEENTMLPDEQAAPRSAVVVTDDESTDAEIGDVSIYRALSSFAPFNELNDMIRRAIANKHQITTKPAGTHLIRRGAEDDVAIYLVAGVLQLEGYDEREFYVASGTERARLPVSLLRPHAYDVKAATEVSVIILSQSLIRKVLQLISNYRRRYSTGIEVTEQP